MSAIDGRMILLVIAMGAIVALVPWADRRDARHRRRLDRTFRKDDE